MTAALGGTWTKLIDRSAPPLIHRFRLERYFYDFTAFAHDCIRWPEGKSLSPYQDEILDALCARQRVAVRGPHGLGKSTIASIAIEAFALTREEQHLDWKIPTTASQWLQLAQYLWPEVHKWARLLDWGKIGRPPFDPHSELLKRNLQLGHGAAFSASPDEPEAIEGAHADYLLYVLDEAKMIGPKTWESIEGAFAGAGPDTASEAWCLAISTPGKPVGTFYDIHARKPGKERWWARHVSLEEAMAAGRVSKEWVDDMRRDFGEQSAVFQNRVLGNFAADAVDSVIPLAWVEAAMLRWETTWPDPAEPLILGADIARGGGDETILARKQWPYVGELTAVPGADTMQITGVLARLLRNDPKAKAVVDVIGIGAGVVDRLREDGLAVVPFNASERTGWRDRSGELAFLNARAGAWWAMREMLDPDQKGGALLALPPDDFLLAELVAPTWKTTSSGHIQIESKDQIRSRLKRSTDRADAVIMACAPAISAGIRIGGTEEETRGNWRPMGEASPTRRGGWE